METICSDTHKVGRNEDTFINKRFVVPRMFIIEWWFHFIQIRGFTTLNHFLTAGLTIGDGFVGEPSAPGLDCVITWAMVYLWEGAG